MTMVQIEAQENGAHANQTMEGTLPIIPAGWAVVLDIEIPSTFPFVNLTTQKVTVDPETDMISEGEEDKLWVVTAMAPGIVPEPEPSPEVTPPPSNEMLSAQVQAISDRQEFIEDCIAEMAMELYQA